MMYPLKFTPIVKPKIWGRERWLLSGIPGNESVVSEGSFKGMTLTDVLRKYPRESLGERMYARSGGEFPLLVKLIEAEQDLSVQVHPDDRLAMERHGCLGKNEMWYVTEAEEGAELVAGLSSALTVEDYVKRAENGTFTDLLRHYKVKAGDVFDIPAGRVHALGGGIKVAEIQQSSDITYRIYDYQRRDAEGHLRELHVMEAKEAIDFSDVHGEGMVAYTSLQNQRIGLVDSTSFRASLFDLTEEISCDYTRVDSFVIYTCVEGGCFVGNGCRNQVALLAGEALLIPVAIKKVQIVPNSRVKILETFI